MSDRRAPRALAVAVAVSAVVLAGAASGAGPRELETSFTLEGASAGDQAGWQVEHTDLDGDGHQDLLVGAWQSDLGGEASGAVHVLYGPVDVADADLGDADLVLYPSGLGEFAGEGPLGVADLDGDGVDDLLVGAPGSFLVRQPGSPGKVGETFLLYGGERRTGRLVLDDAADAVFVGVQVQEWLGFGAAGLGDLDADGFDDVALGAPATAGYSGALYLFHGRAHRFTGRISTTSADATLVGGLPGEMVGYEAAGGDLDGDGASDLVLTGAGQPGPSLPLVRVFYGAEGRRLSGVRPVQTADATVVLPGTSSLGDPTWLVADGDLTGDGLPDLAVGSGSRTPGLDAESDTWIVPGGGRLSGTVAVADVARTTLSGAGDAVDVADVDGDGTSDLVTTVHRSGTVFVVAGPLAAGTSPVEAAAAAVLRLPALDRAGQAVAAADITGDGRTDLLVGGPNGAGRVHVAAGD